MHPHPPRRLSPQRGLTMVGLVLVAILVGFIMLMGARIFPAVNEYLTIRRVVDQIMRNNPGSATEVRSAFEKATEVEYSIHTISAKDLDIGMAGDRLRTSYAYNVEIPVVEPVYLLIKFNGSATAPGGTP